MEFFSFASSERVVSFCSSCTFSVESYESKDPVVDYESEGTDFPPTEQIDYQQQLHQQQLLVSNA